MNATNKSLPKFAYVGCFTSAKRKARGKGISVYSVDPITGIWSLIETFKTLDNPSFLALDRQQNFLYSVHGDSENVCAYRIDKSNGKLSALNSQLNKGDNSVHVSVSHSNKHLAVANGPGIAIFPINDDGSLAPYSDNIVPPGGAGGRHNQIGPHPHQTVFADADKYVLACDHGSDKVHVYQFDAASGKLVSNGFPSITARCASAPRHLVFHPDGLRAYVINELDSTVTAYHWNKTSGELKPFQIITTLPTDHLSDSDASGIALSPCGKFLYISNRGHDSITTFSIDHDSGKLSPIYWEPTQGKTPRFFTLDASGKFLYAANLESHNIVIFQINQTTGVLIPTGQIIETGSPSCIVFTY